ncbi:FHA domain-containing protein [Nannocystis bainbridge]|uniref:FHA domain-containing protein n=1 Tax=Nannocystis bainbridge TaxID=2995303 RepID=A0ABT5E357_9BACT|nr:FHA domain-containing protein [Nannocystis bainbridge]MDC0720297.1 FHA domain-containing protein [Nannocystis bainbridge]
MGALLGLDTGREELLPARCLVGRSRACDLILAARDVSSQHAIVQWTGAVWELQDLGSRNGTIVGEHRLAFGERVPLRRGLVLRFGREAGAFEFVDDAPPRPMAIHLDSGRIRIAEAGLLALPDDDSPELLLYPDGPERWVGERHGELTEVGDRAVVLVRGEMWRVHLPTGGSGTWEEHASDLCVADLRLRFSHSSDEEYVELLALAGERRIDLQARAHHYPLLLLARARLADQQRGVAEPEQGWVHQDKLLAMLKIEPGHLNISIHRSRAQLGQAGVADAARLVERRKGTRQLRLGAAQVEIVRV